MEFLLERLAREAVEAAERDREREEIAKEREAQLRVEAEKKRFCGLLTAVLPEMVEQAYFTTKEIPDDHRVVRDCCCAVLPAAQGVAVSLIWANRTQIMVRNEAYPALNEWVQWHERDAAYPYGLGLIRRRLLVAVASVLDKVRRAEATREANRAA